MAKRERTLKNSPAGQVETFKTLKDAVEPPFPLDGSELDYFTGIVTAREVDTWSDNDKLIAANLAKTYAAIDELWLDIKQRGYMVTNERGTPVVNPAVSALNQMTSTMQSLNRTLGLSASQRGLSGAKQGSRNAADQEARKAIEDAAENSLLA